MKIYVAGKWHDKASIRGIMGQLEKLGHQITHDWTKNEIETRTPEALRYYATLDLAGVDKADILVVIMTDKEYSYRGTFTEIGFAIGKCKPVYLYCDLDPKNPSHHCFDNVFFHYPTIRHYTKLDDLMSELTPK